MFGAFEEDEGDVPPASWQKMRHNDTISALIEGQPNPALSQRQNKNSTAQTTNATSTAMRGTPSITEQATEELESPTSPPPEDQALAPPLEPIEEDDHDEEPPADPIEEDGQNAGQQQQGEGGGGARRRRGYRPVSI